MEQCNEAREVIPKAWPATSRLPLGLRGKEDLIAAKPADAGGIAGYVQPVVVLVEDAEFCTS